jgi:glycerol-3-phosphate acyltransferase PlsX
MAVDVMGGDHGPDIPISGALRAARQEGIRILLVGEEAGIRKELSTASVRGLDVEVVPATETIDMDESPLLAVRRKKNSSIAVAARLVRDGLADGMMSAGNTGAVMATATLILRTIPGVDRAALMAVFPNLQGLTALLDVGANLELKLVHYLQFAGMGHLYCRLILGVPEPRIGLLSIGEEETKGPEELREAARILRESELNFIGNIEGKEIFSGHADVIVCNGFTGNIALKVMESTAEMIAKFLRGEAAGSWLTRLGFFLARPTFRKFRKRVDYAEYGGVPLLGIRGCVVIGHGRSSVRAFHNAIRVGADFVDNRVIERIQEEIPRLGNASGGAGPSTLPRAAEATPGRGGKG